MYQNYNTLSAYMGGLLHVPHAPHVGTLCSPLTTRFSRSVVLVAMGAMLPPIPPSDSWHIVSHMNEVQSFMVFLNACRQSWR